MMCINCGQPAVCQIGFLEMDAYCADCAPDARKRAARHGSESGGSKALLIGAMVFILGSAGVGLVGAVGCLLSLN